MERYIPQFQQNGITSVNQLVHLTEPDLREMGITLAGHLHKLTQSIESGYMELKRTSTIQHWRPAMCDIVYVYVLYVWSHYFSVVFFMFYILQTFYS